MYYPIVIILTKGDRMKVKKVCIVLAVLVFIVQAACAFGGAAATETLLPTEDISNRVATGVAQTQAAQPDVSASTNTPQTFVFPPTITPELPTFTAVPSVQGAVNYGANCRSGPGANFPSLLVYEKGTLVNIIGTSLATDKTTWWLVSSSSQTECWLIDAAISISGDKSSVVKVDSPPTPTPVPPPSWTGTWKVWQWQGITAGNNFEEIINIPMVQTGNYLYWSYIVGDTTFTGGGTISEDGMLVIGTETSNWGGNFGVRLERNPSNLNQFRGRWWFSGYEYADGAYCGSLNGAPKPSPCKP
jgi:hypothetical protein